MKNIIVNQIVVTQTQRNALDIDNLLTAIKAAENVIFERRHKLMEIYNNILIDSHLSGIIQKRKANITNTELQFGTPGTPNKIIAQWIKNPDFYKLLNDIVDTMLFGHTLLEFDFTAMDGFAYTLIARKNIVPSKHIVLRNLQDQDGINYTDNIYKNNILEITYQDRLGLLSKACPWVIYKRNCVADLAQYAELFGQPMREGIYDAHDNKARENLINDMHQTGGGADIIHPKETEIKFIEAQNKSGSAEIYKTLISACNEELSKLLLGNTETTQASKSSGYAQAKVHHIAEEQILMSDRIFVLNTLNFSFKTLLKNNGIAIKDDELFTFKENEQIDPITRIDIDLKLNNIIPISQDYFYETYNIPKPDKNNSLSKQTQTNNNTTPKKENTQDDNNNKKQSALDYNINKIFGFFDSSL